MLYLHVPPTEGPVLICVEFHGGLVTCSGPLGDCSALLPADLLQCYCNVCYVLAHQMHLPTDVNHNVLVWMQGCCGSLCRTPSKNPCVHSTLPHPHIWSLSQNAGSLSLNILPLVIHACCSLSPFSLLYVEKQL